MRILFLLKDFIILLLYLYILSNIRHKAFYTMSFCQLKLPRDQPPDTYLELIVLQEVWSVSIIMRPLPRLHQMIKWRWVIYTSFIYKKF